MNVRRTGAVVAKVLRTLRRDKRSLALAMFAPLVAMAVFGFVFGTEVQDVPVAVVNEDEGDLADDVLSNVDREVLAMTRYATWPEAEAAVRDGRAFAAVRFPANFTTDATPTPGTPPAAGPGGAPVGGEPGTPLQPPRGSRIALVVDGSNSQMVQAMTRALLVAVQETLKAGGSAPPVSLETEYAYASGAEFMDFFVPGIMAFAVLMFTTLLTILAFVGERTSGTLGRLLVTPVTEAEVVLGYALAFSIVGVAQGVLLLAVAVLVFDVLVVGSMVLVFVVVALMAVDALSLGILLSAAARREAQAVQFFPLIAFPTFLLSGIFVPIESLPDWLAPFAWAIPPTYAIEALRAVMLRGWGLEHVWWHLGALVAFAAAFLALAVVGLRRGRVTRR